MSSTDITGSTWDAGTAVPALAATPNGIAVDPSNGDVLIVDTTTDEFYRYNGSTWDAGTAVPALATLPTGIAVDPSNGDVLIVDAATDEFYRYNGSTWDAGTDVPALTGAPAGITVLSAMTPSSLATGGTTYSTLLDDDGYVLQQLTGISNNQSFTITIGSNGFVEVYPQL